MNSDSPLVSIVVPVYNCAEWVGFTVDSVLNQTYTNWELLLINDGSTDNSPKVLESLASKDNRIRVIHQANGKQGKARNNGIRNAFGNWIAFLDADDLWPENKLTDQLEITLKTSVDLSFTDGFICLNNQMELRAYRFGVEDKFHKGPDSVQEFHAQNRIPTSTVMVKKSSLEKYSFFSEENEIQNCEDYLLWTQLLQQGANFLGISQPWLFYRVHEGSSTGLETKALFPLIRALLRIAGAHSEARKNHLERIFIRLTTLLIEQGRIAEIQPLVQPVINEIRSGMICWLMVWSWKVSPRLFVSLLWRTSRVQKN
jgi:teichuronic acid biosynthesis glycosyltransferase TuaG